MKNIKKILAMALTVVILGGNATCANAMSLADKIGTITPTPTEDTRTYSFGGSWTTYDIGIKYISSNTKLTLTMPSNNNLDLIQGTIYFIPLNSGTSINVGYANYASQEYTVDLSAVPTGGYLVKIGGVAVGTSDRATVTYTLK